jgi:hypothetical protein
MTCHDLQIQFSIESVQQISVLMVLLSTSNKQSLNLKCIIQIASPLTACTSTDKTSNSVRGKTLKKHEKMLVSKKKLAVAWLQAWMPIFFFRQ